MRATVETLKARAKIVSSIRAFFDSLGFTEVETDVRIASPAPEANIDCPPVATGGFLRASPELQMKKLLALGFETIYQIGPCFRDGEKGARHNPEFTMIEWYRKNATYLDILDDFEQLWTRLTGDCPQFGRVQNGDCPQFKRIAVREAYRDWAFWDPWLDWNQDRFDYDMAVKIEPALKAIGGGVFLMDYPPQAASLAKLRGDVAERWEFYYDGIELANAFTELCDEAEQRRRFASEREKRKSLGESDYPVDEEFLASLPQIGSAAGVALGVDRLVMVLLSLSSISSVRN
ncbi:MAG: EF-P lysine aminoacylase GenX [Kiritimatiellae bacterium]|nr:EF-P lysine aminoacylase GenX [Kiritimatiellia bacterium]